MDKNLKKGLLIGGLIGGGLVALAMSKKGREICKKSQKYAEEVFTHLKDETFELANLTKEKFNELAERAAEEFVKKKDLALETKDSIVKELEQKWRKLQVSMLFRDIKRRFDDMSEKTRDAYDKLVERATEEFADRKELGFGVRNKLIRELRQRWGEIEKGEEEE